MEHVQHIALFWALAPLYFAMKVLDRGARSDVIWLTLWLIPLFAGPSYNLTIFVVAAVVLTAWEARSIVAETAKRQRFAIVTLCAIGAFALSGWIWFRFFQVYASGISRDVTHNNVYRWTCLAVCPGAEYVFLQGNLSAFVERGHLGVPALLCVPWFRGTWPIRLSR